MNIPDSIVSALTAILANKMRSLLTMLGVVIGVGSVIAMIGIGEGTKQKSLESIEKMGTNVLMVMPNWRRGGVSGGAGGDVPTLKDEDVQAIRRGVPQLVSAVTGVVDGRVAVKYKNQTAFTRLNGAEPQYAQIRNANNYFQGGWYTDEDERQGARKVVLGFQVYQELFDTANAVGATIKIQNQDFQVLGVVAYKGGSGMMSQDDQIYVPLKTAREKLLGRKDLDDIVLSARYGDLMAVTQSRVEDTLSARRKNASGEPLFRVMNQGDIVDQLQTQAGLLSMLLAGIASVSLLVGGIGIMNIMLVSVTERTHEIGLRKAVGARRESILSQFLLESVVMCVVGGILGILLGSVAVIGVAKLLKVPPLINSQAIVLSFGFSAMVGLFFGLYPALRASSLQPIEALRHE
jgi:putative ABC transport system permease protein